MIVHLRLAGSVLPVALLSLLLAAAVLALVAFAVAPTGETDPHIGNADDPAIWVHPTDPSMSMVIGTFKSRGLSYYDLDGALLGAAWDADMNNVDLRYNFSLDGELVDLVIATSPPDNTLFIYKVDPASRTLVNVTGTPVESPMSQVYGFCLYHSPSSGLLYAIITGDLGEVEQYELSGNGAGGVDATLVRSFILGTAAEGCVADDEYQTLYVGEEDVALWKFDAEPGSGSNGTQVDVDGGNLNSDIEGVTIYRTGDGAGYLLVSSQGSDDFAVYERLGDNAYITRFNIAAGNGIDVVGETDGIDVINVNLDGQYSQGLFVAHDDADDVEYNNFKYVPWDVIATAADPPLTIDTSWDPRASAPPPPVNGGRLVYLSLIVK